VPAASRAEGLLEFRLVYLFFGFFGVYRFHLVAFVVLFVFGLWLPVFSHSSTLATLFLRGSSIVLQVFPPPSLHN
jgi:hypothetical protein